LDRQRQSVEELRRQLQCARTEEEAAWKAAHEAEDRFKQVLQIEQEGDGTGEASALAAALSLSGGTLAPVPEGAEAPGLNWEVPDEFRDQLGPNLRLPQADLKQLEDKPIYHGVLGMMKNGEFEVKYCCLYTDGLECFNEPSDIPKGHRPGTVLDMHQCSVIEFDKATHNLLLQFQDDADVAISVRSTEALRGWYKAFVTVINRQEEKEANNAAKSPRELVKKKTFFSSRASKKGSWTNVGTNNREAALLIHGNQVDHLAFADRPGGNHVKTDVSDKLNRLERSVSPSPAGRNSAVVGSDKITGDRVLPPPEEPNNCTWLKITHGSDGEGQRQQRGSSRSRGDVTGKVNAEGKVPLATTRSGNKKSAGKITGTQRSINRAPSEDIPTKVGEIVL